MTTAQAPTTATSRPQQTAASPEINASTADLLVSLASQARALRRPTLVCVAASVGAALIIWLCSFASFMFDSRTAAILCVTFLAISLAPGAFFFWIYWSLRDVARLPGRFRLPSRPLPTEDPREMETMDAEEPLLKRWSKHLRQRAEDVYVVWSQLEYFDWVSSLEGRGLLLSFLSKPFSKVVIGVVLLASTLLIAAAAFSLFGLFIGMVS